MAKIKTKEIDFTSGNLFKKMILYTVPLILSTLLQLFYSSADLFTVGKFGGGESSLNAVGANGSLINLIVALFTGLSVGANVYIANAKGRNDKEAATKGVATAIILSFVVGIIVMVFGTIFAKELLILMNTPEEVLYKATQYLTIYFYGIPCLMIYNYGSACLRALGDSRKPFWTLVFSGIFNIACNFLLVINFKMDVEGVAISTIISEAVSAIAVLMFLFMNKHGFAKLSFSTLRVSKVELISILKIGIFAGLESFIFSFANVFIQREANTFGNIAMAGNTASNNIEGYLYNILFAFSVAVVAMVAQNYGAKKKENIKKILIYALSTVIVLGLTMGIFTTIFSTQLLGIFVNNPESIEIGRSRLIVISMTYFLCGTMDILSSYLRGLEHPVTPTVITLFGACVLRLAFIFTLFKTIPEIHTLQWLYATFPISWALVNIIYIPFVIIISKKEFKQMDLKMGTDLTEGRELATNETTN